jgi:hypothetical protein
MIPVKIRSRAFKYDRLTQARCEAPSAGPGYVADRFKTRARGACSLVPPHCVQHRGRRQSRSRDFLARGPRAATKARPEAPLKDAAGSAPRSGLSEALQRHTGSAGRILVGARNPCNRSRGHAEHAGARRRRRGQMNTLTG